MKKKHQNILILTIFSDYLLILKIVAPALLFAPAALFGHS